MATKKNAEPSEQKPEKQKQEKQPKKAARADAPQEADAAPKEDTLQKAAKAIGSALGTMAVKTGIAHPATPPRKKIPKLVKKTKSRLPRKEKKQAKKKLAKSAG
jgi:hypothetical protein